MAEICTFITSLHLKIISSTVTNQRLRDDNYPRFPLDRSTFIIIQCEVFYIILKRRAPRILLLSENYSPVIASATTDKRYFETNHPLMITLRKALISALVLGVSIVKKIQMFMFTTLAWISGF